MEIDEQRIINKTGYIKEQVSNLRRLVVERAREDIINDPWVINGMKYSIQTSIEACIDLTYHFCAKKLGYAPQDARDGFKRLASDGIISEADLEAYSQMIGFRNRVVHGYQNISAEVVYEIAKEDIGDLERFVEIIMKALKNN